jgi:hypothetical protein
MGRSFLTAAIAAMLFSAILPCAVFAQGTTAPGSVNPTHTPDISAADATKFIRDTLLHDGHGYSAEFYTPDGLDFLSDVVLTHNNVTFTQTSGHAATFSLRDLKITYAEDFLGNVSLQIGDGDNSIVFTDNYSRDTIKKIAADFAVLIRAAETPEAVPTVPAPVIAASAEPGHGSYAGRRLAIRVTQNCSNKPSAASFLLDEDEDDCEAGTLETIRKDIAQVFDSRGAFAGVSDDNPDLVLTVTMTSNILDTSGLFGDFTAESKMSATYALADKSGRSILSGTVDDAVDGDDYDEAAIQHFADKLASSVMAQVPPL